MKSQVIGKERRYYEEVDSTNIKAKEWAREGAGEGSLILADKQISGKGRSGRVWDSPAGVGIWMSLILRPNLSPQAIPQLTLVAGLAMCKSIQEATGLKACIKWPNDIVIDGKKVCGILCEMQATKDQVKYAVVGIGVNVNTEAFPETLPHASSLYLLSGIKEDREKIIDLFCKQFEVYYNTYCQTKSLSFLLEDYRSNCITLNNKVKIVDTQESYEAYAIDISREGHLTIQLSNGCMREILAGEVSVRGLYGYI